MAMLDISKRMVRWSIGIVILLLVPLVLTLLDSGVDGDGWHWTFFDFVFMCVLLFGSAFAYEIVVNRINDNNYRLAVGISVVTTVILVWMNAAVGIIGNEDNPINFMYFGVVFVGIGGSFLARFEPSGMARALFATAIAQMLIPLIAFILKRPDFTIGVFKVFILNAFFALLWISSAILFRGTPYLKSKIFK